ncbi:MAG: GNAT family N-acetyltransferase [Candidatus Moraniibacteriota bacterium]
MPTNAVYDVQLHGIRGLLQLDDSTLEQIRVLQLEISPRRLVGKTVPEYRRLLNDRLERLVANHGLMNDNATTLLRCRQHYGEADGKKVLLSPIIMGMLTYQAVVGQSFSNGHVWDLMIAEAFRGHGISQALLHACHTRFKTLGVTRSFAFHSRKRASAFRKIYLASGYREGPYGQLEYRFKDEG